MLEFFLKGDSQNLFKLLGIFDGKQHFIRNSRVNSMFQELFGKHSCNILCRIEKFRLAKMKFFRILIIFTDIRIFRSLRDNETKVLQSSGDFAADFYF